MKLLIQRNGTTYSLEDAHWIVDDRHDFIDRIIGIESVRCFAAIDRRHMKSYVRMINSLTFAVIVPTFEVEVESVDLPEHSQNGYIYLYASINELRKMSNDMAIYFRLEHLDLNNEPSHMHVVVYPRQLGYGLEVQTDEDKIFMNDVKIANLIAMPHINPSMLMTVEAIPTRYISSTDTKFKLERIEMKFGLLDRIRSLFSR